MVDVFVMTWSSKDIMIFGLIDNHRNEVPMCVTGETVTAVVWWDEKGKCFNKDNSSESLGPISIGVKGKQLSNNLLTSYFLCVNGIFKYSKDPSLLLGVIQNVTGDLDINNFFLFPDNLYFQSDENGTIFLITDYGDVFWMKESNPGIW